MSTPTTRRLPAWMKGHEPSSPSSKMVVECLSPSPNHSEKESPPQIDVEKRVVAETLSDESENEELSDNQKLVSHTISEEGESENKSISEMVLSKDSSELTNHKEELVERNCSPVTQMSISDNDNMSTGINTTMYHSLSPGTTVPSNSEPASRPSCYYGSSCYRKNPQHKIEYAHPGDPDFHDTARTSGDTNSSQDDRPLCEYGSACYRKNPQHRKDFRHDNTRKRKARPVGMQDIPSDDDGDFNGSIGSDEYSPGGSELDDSFVTSDSMESGDSDYSPDEEETKLGDQKQKKVKSRKKVKKPKTT